MRARSRLMPDCRGVSEMVGATLVLLMVFGASMAYVSVEMLRVRGHVSGVTELIRDAGHRQAQLLSLIYYTENRVTGVLRIYMFNYGTENAEIDRMLIGTGEVKPSIHDSFTDAALESLPPRTLAEISLPLPAERTFDFTLITRVRAVYSYRLTVG